MKINTNNKPTANLNNTARSIMGIMLLSFTAFSTTVISTSVNAEIYKWTDAQGQVHYSATPPTKKVKTKEIGSEIRMAAGKFDPSSVKLKDDTDESEAGNKSNDPSENTGKNKATKERIAYCKTQRKNLALLTNNKNIRWKSFGKETELTAAQRKSKMKQIKSQISEECKGI